MILRTLTVALVIALSMSSCEKEVPKVGAVEESSEDAPPAMSKHEEIANEFMDVMQEFATVVTNVSDLESANEAAAKISEIGDRYSKIGDELKTLDPPSEELKKEIYEKMEARDEEMQKVMGEDLQETMQSLSPEAQQVLRDAFMGFFEKMNSVGKEFERHFGVDDETEN